MQKILGLITARGGSKGLLRKNIVELERKPLIAWTIEAALQSGRLSRIVVSTDDEEIRKIAIRYGAEAPFIRPSNLAQDDSSHISVVQHAVSWLEKNESYTSDSIMLLQPTSPLRTCNDINETICIYTNKNANGVISVCETHHHPYLIKKICEDGTLEDFLKNSPGIGSSNIRRQSLPSAYFINGAIYLVKRECIMDDNTFLPLGTYPYVMPKIRSLQVDDILDLKIIESILRNNIDINKY